MQFIIKAYDGKDAYERRMSVRPQHLENVAKIKEKGSVVCAGGLTNEDGKLIGSVLILDFASREMVDEYLETEPYVVNKVWEDITVEAINVVMVNDEKVGK